VDTEKITVPLHHLRSPAIVAEFPTGVIYHNQTHGVANHQSKAEGFLVPLPPVASKFFNPHWWYYAWLGMGRPDGHLRAGKTLDQAQTEIDSDLAYLGSDQAAVIKAWCDEPVMSRTEIYREIESLVNGLIWDGLVRNFRITHSAEPCSTICDYYADEAWLLCAFELEQDAYALGEKGLPRLITTSAEWEATHPYRTFGGFLTWENSD
jgi:hypothetical protein